VRPKIGHIQFGIRWTEIIKSVLVQSETRSEVFHPPVAAVLPFCSCVPLPEYQGGRQAIYSPRKQLTLKLLHSFIFSSGVAFWVLTFKGHFFSILFGGDKDWAALVSQQNLVNTLPAWQMSARGGVGFFVCRWCTVLGFFLCFIGITALCQLLWNYSKCYCINYIKTTSPVTLSKSYFQQCIFCIYVLT